eukprot:SAG31_NODE_1162_length_9594_cov_3.045498_3_plen_131_part_00
MVYAPRNPGLIVKVPPCSARRHGQELLLAAECARLQAKKRLLLHQVAADGRLAAEDYEEISLADASERATPQEVQFAASQSSDLASVRADHTKALRLEMRALVHLAGLMERAVRAVTFSFLCNYSRNTGL